MENKEILYGELIDFLKKNGYYNLRHIEGVGICGMRNFLFTIGLCYGLTRNGFSGRYCYPRDLGSESTTECDVETALKVWNGKNSPVGNWIKHKGEQGDWTNPNYKN